MQKIARFTESYKHKQIIKQLDPKCKGNFFLKSVNELIFFQPQIKIGNNILYQKKKKKADGVLGVLEKPFLRFEDCFYKSRTMWMV